MAIKRRTQESITDRLGQEIRVGDHVAVELIERLEEVLEG